MQTILGAGGVIATGLVDELARAQPARIRLVARRLAPAPGAVERVAADLCDLDQAVAAIAGSAVVYLLVGLQYDARIWAEMWPRVMRNTIEACKRTGAKLIFFDNVYAYGKVSGAMTERTPFAPCSRKGEIRAAIAGELLREIDAGDLTALIARSADFYGPAARTSVLNVLVVDRLARGGAALWLGNDKAVHSFTFTIDAAKALAQLARSDSAWNQTWHLPTRPQPPTGPEYVRIVADALGVAPKCRVLGRTMVRLAGLFVPDVRETHEMLYQFEHDYVFDSTKFAAAFGVEATPYDAGLRRTVQAQASGAG